jgi:hypothetical protein
MIALIDSVLTDVDWKRHYVRHRHSILITLFTGREKLPYHSVAIQCNVGTGYPGSMKGIAPSNLQAV